MKSEPGFEITDLLSRKWWTVSKENNPKTAVNHRDKHLESRKHVRMKKWHDLLFFNCGLE
jgi:hypothetical protein